jgi:excisionase family DNA binding protein
LLPRVEQLLGVVEVAELLGLCRDTIYKLCDDGTLAHYRVRNRIRVPLSAVQEYLSRAEKGALR